MRIEYFERAAFRAEPKPDRPGPPFGWAYGSNGGMVAAHFTSAEHKAGAKAVHATPVKVVDESHFELCVLASMLRDITSETLVFMELGAGWGGQSLNVTQMVRNRVASTWIRDTWCFAVEAEPGHHGFVCETFRVNNIPGVVLFGAVSDSLDWVKFYSKRPPAANYGQSIRASGNLLVPCFTVDYLVETFGLTHVDILHMDVQGHEPQSLKGAQRSIARGIIDHMLVCPHYGTSKAEIVSLVERDFEIVMSIGARAGYLTVPGFPNEVYHPQDGIVVCKRKPF